MRYQYQILQQAPQNAYIYALIIRFVVYIGPILEFVAEYTAGSQTSNDEY